MLFRRIGFLRGWKSTLYSFLSIKRSLSSTSKRHPWTWVSNWVVYFHFLPAQPIYPFCLSGPWLSVSGSRVQLIHNESGLFGICKHFCAHLHVSLPRPVAFCIWDMVELFSRRFLHRVTSIIMPSYSCLTHFSACSALWCGGRGVIVAGWGIIRLIW